MLDGCKGRKPRIIRSLFLKEGALEDWNKELQKKYEKMRRNEIRFERYKTDNAKLILVAYGTSARIARASVDELRKNGKLAGMFRPISLWPFPYNKLKKLDKGKTKFLVIEMSAGQMIEDVKLAIEDSRRVYFHGRMGGGVPEQSDIVKIANKILK